jgi:hypothetical protein
VLEVILGAIIAIVITVCVESLRKPRLTLTIEAPVEVTYGPGSPAGRARYVRVRCGNRPLPRWFRWMARNAALQCHGTVTFYHTDGQNYFGRSMPIRWSDSTQPIDADIYIGGMQGRIVDWDKRRAEPRVEIYPGEDAPLDIAVRFDNDVECYGWTNLNYSSNPPLRNPQWKIRFGRYVVKVAVVSAGEGCEGKFRLVNDVSQWDFRLEMALPGDRIRD